MRVKRVDLNAGLITLYVMRPAKYYCITVYMDVRIARPRMLYAMVVHDLAQRYIYTIG